MQGTNNYVGVSSQTASPAAVADRRHSSSLDLPTFGRYTRSSFEKEADPAHSSSLDLPTFGRYTRSNFEKEAEPAQFQPSLTHFSSTRVQDLRKRQSRHSSSLHLPTFRRRAFKIWERGRAGTVPAFTYPLFDDTRSRFEKEADGTVPAFTYPLFVDARSRFEKEADPAQFQPSLTHFSSTRVQDLRKWQTRHSSSLHLPTFRRRAFKIWERGRPGTVPAFTYPLFVDARSRFEKVADPAQFQPSLTHFSSTRVQDLRKRQTRHSSSLHLPTFRRRAFKIWESGRPGLPDLRTGRCCGHFLRKAAVRSTLGWSA